MKKMFIFCSLIFMIPVFAASERDVFDELLEFVQKQNTEIKVEVIEEGVSLDDMINSNIVTEFKNQDIVIDVPKTEANKVPSIKPSKPYDDKIAKYFVGTKDFTNLETSSNDSLVNNWSAINRSYNKYDNKSKNSDLTIVATAYTSAAEENGGYEGMNAIGGSLGKGCIAAPKDIPFHTKIRIDGLGVFNVEDRGSAIVRIDKNIIRIDIWMDGYKEAMRFGKRVYKGAII